MSHLLLTLVRFALLAVIVWAGAGSAFAVPEVATVVADDCCQECGDCAQDDAGGCGDECDDPDCGCSCCGFSAQAPGSALHTVGAAARAVRISTSILDGTPALSGQSNDDDIFRPPQASA